MITSRSFLLRMRNVSDKSSRANQNRHFVYSKFFFSKNRTVYEMMWKRRPQLAIWRTRIVRWTTKATNTHSEYVTLIAFPLQQWLHNASQRYATPAVPVLLTAQQISFQWW